MNTLIESINKITKIKSELNQILQENGIDGGDVFSEYPDKFRELFRIVDVYTDSTYDGYDEVAVNVVTIVPEPRMSVYQNIVTITCDLDEASIYYWIKTDSGENEVGVTALTKGNTVVMSESGTVFCYAKFREETSNTVSIYCQVEQIIVPDPPRITRDGTTVTIEKFGDDDIIYYSTGGDYELYTGPITVYRYEDVYAFTQNYRGRSNIIIDEAPEQPVLPDVPVMSYTPNTLTITCTTVGADIYYKKTTDQYWVKYTSPITLTQSGIYITKSLKDGLQSEESDGLFCQFIETPSDPVFNVVDNKVYIVCATGADIYYKIGSGEYQLYTGPITLTETVVISAYADNQGIESDTVTQTCTYVEPVVPTPPADPVISCSNNIVTITCSTSGATIYYRTDSGNWLTYSGPIEISETLTFSSYSSKNGLNSDVVSQECEYVAPVTPEIPEVPVFSCSNNIVSITCSTINASIYYRDVNDSTWTLYNGPFSISQTTQFVAYSYKNGQNSSQSSVFTATYIPDVVIPDDPVISCIDNLVSITCATSGATIYYKINDGSFTTYVNSIEINSDITVYAYAELNSVTSNTVSMNCYYVNYNTPLTFSILSDGVIKWTAWKFYPSDTEYQTKTILYNLNNSGWTEITSTGSGYEIPVETGDVIKFRCKDYPYNNDMYGGKSGSVYSNRGSNFYGSTASFNVYGNIQSMLCGSNTSDYNRTDLFTKSNVFSSLFESCDIINAKNLLLPATSLTSSCYGGMFYNCSNLITAPTLPAINLSGTTSCYANMFQGCSSLTIAPALPATTLGGTCYWQMFDSCTSLINAPELPAITLAEGCYREMFYSCTSLTTAPDLLAETLVSNCYAGMFSGCTSLNYIKCTAWLGFNSTRCLDNWVRYVGSTGRFIRSQYASWSRGSSGIPTGWTVQSI